MAKKDPLAWNGAHKPKKPTEGFATSLGVSVGSGGPQVGGAPRPRSPRGPSLLEKAEGLNVEVHKLGESDGPEVVRPTGRVRLTRS